MDSTIRTDDFNKRRKATWASYIIGGIIFLIFIILVFLYAILRVRSIKIHLQSVNIKDLVTNNRLSPAASFSMLLKAQVTIKNSNFGHYKFENSTLVLAYRGTHVGEAGIGKGLVKARSMKRINIVAKVSSSSWKRDDVSSDYRASSQKIKLAASAQVTGKVHVLKIIRRKKIAKMNCIMELDTKTQTIDNMHCK
uniref:late embryogenesis abundant protein At1g64065-like n=1 Tax=Erigeron canadensis TaxID=72917 RepID=UPI001CB97600|nr:late embryogenesis abundant protein At1g64065-like [Erigeron canadensis]